MFPKQLLTLTLFAALAVMPAGVLRTQWVQTNGPEGGIITAFAASGINLIAGTEGGGIYFSTNNGKSWTPKKSGLTNSDVSSLATSGTNIFAGTYGGGVFLSTNNGSSWANVSGDLKNKDIRALEMNGSNILAGNDDGGFISSDNGSTWTEIGNGLSGEVLFFATSGINLFAGISGKGLFSSSDNGASWISDTGLTNPNVTSFIASGSNLFVGTYDSGIFLSTNNGENWAPVNNGLSGWGLYIQSLAASGSKLFAGSYNGVFVSSNNGESWTQTSGIMTNVTVTSLLVTDSNIFAGTGAEGVFLSTNSGSNWINANSGLSNTNIRAMGVDGASLVVGAFNDGMFLSTNDGISWTSESDGLGGTDLSALASIGNNLFATTFDEGIFLSTNAGANWTSESNGIASSNFDALAVSGTTIYAGGNGVFFSTDSGANWSILSDELDAVSLAVSGQNLFVGTASDGIYFTTNNDDMNWTAVNTGLTSLRIYALLVIDSNATTPMILAGSYGNGIFLSTDNGTSWTSASTGLVPSSKTVLCFTKIDKNLFAGTFGGVFLSTNNGSSWTNVSDSLTDSVVYSLTISGANIFAGTENNGVWRRPLSDFGISSVTQTATTTTPEIQSYPNPFSQSTQITFTSQAAGYAEISIVNMLGIEVARLFSGELGAGEHNFPWSNPTGLPDGTYECLVRMNGQVQALPVVKF